MTGKQNTGLITLIIAFILSVSVPTAWAQKQITLKAVIDTTLQNHYGIKMAENEAEIARLSSTPGMAGQLPWLSAGGSGQTSLYNTSQTYETGIESNEKGVSTNTVSGGLDAGMTLFNGFRVLAAKERLALLEQKSEHELNYEIQSAIAEAMIGYYNVIRQQQYQSLTNQLLDVAEKNFELVQTRKQVGLASEADILQAEMDVSVAGEKKQQQEIQVRMAGIELLQVMCSTSFDDISVIDSIPLSDAIPLDSLLGSLKNSPVLLAARMQTEITRQLAREAAGSLYPSLKLNASYDVQASSINTGNLRRSTLDGPAAGVTLQIPLFYGGLHKTQAKTARIAIENATLNEEYIRLQMEGEARKLHHQYTQNLARISELESAYRKAEELNKIVNENFSHNHATILEVKAAQASFENAGYQLINLKYETKMAEIRMLAMMYRLKP